VTGPRAASWVSVGAAILALSLLAGAAALTVVAFRGPGRTSSLQDRVHGVASTLRCPVCQNLSVADSPSRLAQQMRETIAAELQAGRSSEQIRAEFVGAYGEWILLSPPKHGIDLVAWAGPVLMVLVGLVVGGLALRKWTAGQGEEAGEALSARDRGLLEKALSKIPDEPEEVG
jgi:cytochrome c-type biogenesis protein CcmH